MLNIPTFILPDGLTNGKFIQAYVNGQPFFRAEIGWYVPRHALIFSRLLSELRVQFNAFYEHEPNKILKCPDQKGYNYELVGAGRIVIWGSETEFVLTGDSATYELKPNQRHLDDLVPHLPEGIKLRIDCS